MKRKHLIYIVLILMINLTYLPLSAQNGDMSLQHQNSYTGGKSIIKANLSGLALQSYGLSAEQILSKRVTIVLGVNKMPERDIPYLDKIIQLGNSEELETEDWDKLEKIRIGLFSVTPEIRFYLSKSGYGKGFYIAPYYRFEKYSASDFEVDFVDENNINQDIIFNGILNTHSLGLGIGAQWFLGKQKNMVIDWNIVGMHYGFNHAGLDGKSSYTLSEKDQLEAKKAIEENIGSVKIGDLVPIKLKHLEVHANDAKMDISSPWAFIKASLSFGLRF